VAPVPGVFLCSPGNPTGAVLPLEYLRRALELADRFDFVIAADECYTEIYLDERAPPPGLLQACLAAGHDWFQRCVVFHSLSKRSSVPGLRSGFVAGDPLIMQRFLLYRTYHGAPWRCRHNSRVLLRGRKMGMRWRIVGCTRRSSTGVADPGAGYSVERPAGAFYLGPMLAGMMSGLLASCSRGRILRCCRGAIWPGLTLRGEPGYGRVRISLVAPVAQCVEAAERIRDFLREE